MLLIARDAAEVGVAKVTHKSQTKVAQKPGS